MIVFGTDKPRWYKHKGKFLPSVTTILSLLDIPFLKQWAADCAVENLEEFILDFGLPEKGESKSGYLKRLQNEFVLQGEVAKYEYKDRSKQATDLGTLIHNDCEAYLKALIAGTASTEPIEIDEDSLADEEFRRIKIKANFRAWCVKHEVQVLATEKLVTNDTSYKGRMDIACVLNAFWLKGDDNKETKEFRKIRVKALVDIKTSKQYSADYGMQTAAYKHAYFEDVEQTCLEDAGDARAYLSGLKAGKKLPIPICNGVLRIDKVSCRCNYKDYTPFYERDLEGFRLLNEFYNLYNSPKGK